MKPYKRPESVLVVIYTPAGSVLLLRRRDPPDFWQSVTGSLEWGESPAEAARRELYEETGFQHAALEDCRESRRFSIVPPWTRRYAPGVVENLEHVFRLCLPEPIDPHLNPREHGEFAWVTRAVAAAKVASWTNRAAILAHVPTEGTPPL